MAALGKIRSKGVVLVCIIGLGLLAFIAEEAFRSCESTHNDQRQQVGEVLGKKINVQDFQKLVDEYTEVIKLQQGSESLTDEQMNSIKDYVWSAYLQDRIIEKETEALGIAVTDTELQNILNEGTNSMLKQTPFLNEETGLFDVNVLKKFLADYKVQQATNAQIAAQYEPLYKYWTFVEKNLRRQLLIQKYQSLFSHCLFANKVQAEMAFNGTKEESKIELASFPYTSIEDNAVEVSDAEMKAKYKELKELFRQTVESRDIKYVSVKVKASDADRAALQQQFDEYAKELAEAVDPSDIVHKSMSQVSYLGVPVAKSAYSADISRRFDSISVGGTTPVFEYKRDNTLNVVKLISKQQLPDSVQFRQIEVYGYDVADADARADSILTALKGGADFETLAKTYGQTGASSWLITRQYQSSVSLDKDTRNYINLLNRLGVNEYEDMPINQGHLIVQVVDRRSMIDKYVAAVIKRTIDFSRETYSAAYNKFSSFVSANQTIEDIENNAQKNDYSVLERKNITTSDHYIANIRGTRDALKWLFESKKGDISPMYECGDNDNLLLVMLTNVSKKGYRTLDDNDVKERVKAEVLKDKKSAQLFDKIKEVKDMEGAKKAGATVSTIDQITFDAPAFIRSTGTSEPALSGAVAATAEGAFSATPVVGKSGVYLFQVTEKGETADEYDETEQLNNERQKMLQAASNFMNELILKAKVVDNRYLFF